MATVSSLQVPSTEHDDPAFVDLASRILNAAVECYTPDEIFIVQIDNWFGPGWKRFPAGIGSMRRIRWFKSLVLPPFHPHRVKTQVHLELDGSEERTYREKPAPRLHLSYETNRGSSYHSLRHLSSSSSAMCLWYSSNTTRVDRASLMVYEIEAGKETAWYTSFLRCGEWKLETARGISPERVLQFAADRPIRNSTPDP